MSEQPTTETATLPPALAAKIAAMPFTATLTHRAKNPDDGPDTWSLTLNREPFPYSKGVGLRVFTRRGWTGYQIEPGDYLNGRPRNAYAAEAWPHYWQPVTPTALELLVSLLLDASCYTDSRDLDDFAADFCAEGKIQETLDTYNACARAGRLLRRWFSAAELDALAAWAVEQ